MPLRNAPLLRARNPLAPLMHFANHVFLQRWDMRLCQFSLVFSFVCSSLCFFNCSIFVGLHPVVPFCITYLESRGDDVQCRQKQLVLLLSLRGQARAAQTQVSRVCASCISPHSSCSISPANATRNSAEPCFAEHPWSDQCFSSALFHVPHVQAAQLDLCSMWPTREAFRQLVPCKGLSLRTSLPPSWRGFPLGESVRASGSGTSTRRCPGRFCWGPARWDGLPGLCLMPKCPEASTSSNSGTSLFGAWRSLRTGCKAHMSTSSMPRTAGAKWI